MTNNIRDGLCFDDVLLVPKYSTIKSRSDVDISVNMGLRQFSHPIIPANMKTITGVQMAYAVIESGGFAILHRFMSLEDQLTHSNELIDNFGDMKFAVSVGVKKEEWLNIQKFMEIGVRNFCIDIAHGDSEQCVNMVDWIKNVNPDLFVIAGNVATGSGATRLWKAGADAVKVGIGPGSLCTTRIETAAGAPQLTALMDVAVARTYLTKEIPRPNFTKSYDPDDDSLYDLPSVEINRPLYIIADGGIKNAGDIVKALCFSDMVMAGNLFAGCPETPGNLIYVNGQPHKEYVGSSTHKGTHVEGVSAIVQQKPPYKEVLGKLIEGLRSGLSYQGATNLKKLRESPEFIKISNAGLKESHPHDITIRK
jgi:IMP dehydrogenase